MLGIAIGVGAIVAVLGLSASNQAGLLADIDRFGTNPLKVTNVRHCRARPPSIAPPGSIIPDHAPEPPTARSNARR